jgi:threonine/homoserine/homoserine lactone efflux protein
MKDPLLFSLAVTAILGVPGSTNTLLATGGAVLRLRQALLLVAAGNWGYNLSILTIGLVAGPLIDDSPIIGMLLRLTAGLYLFFLAWRLHHGGSPAMNCDVPITPARVFMANLLNPKALILATTVFPFGSTPIWPYMLGFSSIVLTAGCVWVGAGALTGRVPAAADRSSLMARLGVVVIGTFGFLLVASPLVK